jgi:hypothetical protein
LSSVLCAAVACPAVLAEIIIIATSPTTRRLRLPSGEPSAGPDVRNAKPLWLVDTGKVIRTNDRLLSYWL